MVRDKHEDTLCAFDRLKKRVAEARANKVKGAADAEQLDAIQEKLDTLIDAMDLLMEGGAPGDAKTEDLFYDCAREFVDAEKTERDKKNEIKMVEHLRKKK
jgi:hypothetical protein